MAVDQLGHVLGPDPPPARKRGVLHEKPVARKQARTVLRGMPVVAAIRTQHPALCLIGQVRGHDLAGDLGMDSGVGDLDQGFDTAIQVAAHPVCGRI